MKFNLENLLSLLLKYLSDENLALCQWKFITKQLRFFFSCSVWLKDC